MQHIQEVSQLSGKQDVTKQDPHPWAVMSLSAPLPRCEVPKGEWMKSVHGIVGYFIMAALKQTNATFRALF